MDAPPDVIAFDPDRLEGTIPQSLRERRQWVCWKYVMRDGKWTKVPICPAQLRAASTTDPATWGTFEEALVACRRSAKLIGIGFVFTPDDPYCGIDLDGCVVDGEIVPEARKIIEELASYAEISPSRTGVKAFVMAKKPEGSGCKSRKVEGFKHIEIYDQGRFFTVTGLHVTETPLMVNDCQEQVTALCARLWPNPSRTTQAPTAPIIADRAGPSSNGNAVDMAVREKRCQAYLARCPDAISGNGGHDATLRAACECFRFGLDDAAAWRILRFFNDQKTNGERWTDKELAHKLESARQKVAAAGEFGVRLVNLRAPLETMGADQIAALTTDVGNAARLVQRFGHQIRFCHGLRQWYIWDGRRWKADDRGTIVKLCKQTALQILDEARRAPEEKRDRLAAWAMSSQKRDRIAAMAALAQPDVAVAPDDLDSDLWAFNCLNGTIDLETGNLRPHCPTDLITKLAPVEYDPKATCPRFELFLKRVFANEIELIQFVQRFLGMSLTGDVREQLLLIFYGEGNNGKNVLLDTNTGLMGDYASEAPPDLLTVTKHREHPTEIADLCGRRLVIASESEEAATLRLQLVKRLTGNARLKGRFMRKDYFEFRRTHKLILVTNNRPVIRENSEAAWRRIRLVPFSVVIPPDERDPELLEKLATERAGILAWLVRGCLDWQRVGLGEPAAVSEATSNYRVEQDFLSEFISERCIVQPQAWVSRTAIFAEYQEWSQRVGERQPLDRAALYDRLRRTKGVEEGWGQQHGRRTRGFNGLGVQVRTPEGVAEIHE